MMAEGDLKGTDASKGVRPAAGLKSTQEVRVYNKEMACHKMKRGGRRRGPLGSTRSIEPSASHDTLTPGQDDLQFEMLMREPQSRPQPQPQHQPQPQPQPQLDPEAVDGSIASIGEGGSVSSGARKRRGRGPCSGKSLAPRNGGVWTMQYNSDGLPTGEPAMKLHRKIGDLVRDPRYCPLGHRWKDVPAQGKEDMWDELLVEYDFGGHPNMKKYVFDHAQLRYKDWKNYLKHDIWSKYKHDEELLNAKLECRVLPDQFKKMVEYWESEGGKTEASRLSTNRSKKLMQHHSGTQTFVQLGTKMTTNGVKPHPMDVFMKAYTPKDPAKDPQTVRMLEEISIVRQSQSSQGSEATSSMQPILTQVLGEGKGRYVRGLGGHHTRKDAATSEGQYMTQQMAKLVNVNQTLTSTVQQLQTKLDDTNNVNQNLQTQLDDMNTAVGFMKDWMSSLCGKLNMPVPNIPMRLSTVDERRSAADEAQGSRPDSSRQE